MRTTQDRGDDEDDRRDAEPLHPAHGSAQAMPACARFGQEPDAHPVPMRAMRPVDATRRKNTNPAAARNSIKRHDQRSMLQALMESRRVALHIAIGAAGVDEGLDPAKGSM